MALTIERRPGETVEIGGPCCVTVGKTTSSGTTIHLDAPDSTKLMRGELFAAEQMRADRLEPAKPKTGRREPNYIAHLQKERDQLMGAWVALKGLVQHGAAPADPVGVHVLDLMDEALAAAGLG